MDIKTLITNAKRRLKQNGHNVTEVIANAGVDPAAVWKLEAGKAKTMQPMTAARLELASPNGEFDCQQLNPDAYETYRKIFERRGVLKTSNQDKPTEINSAV